MPTRFQDTPIELRVRLKLTMKMHETKDGGGEHFFHEQAARSEQFLSATLSKDGKTMDVTVFKGKIPASLFT